jgi:hypothetical protein
MSQEDKELKSTIAVGTTKNSPMGPNGKASAAAPKLSDDDHVEMEEILASGSAVNPDEDIMQLARLGDIQAIEKLFDSGKFDASYADKEGITPLHVCLPILVVYGVFTDILAVGGYQQPICYVPISPQGWRRCQQEGGRISCDSRNVGCTKVSLLYSPFTTRKRRGSSCHRHPRLQYPTSRNFRRQYFPPRPPPSPKHISGYPG